MDKHSQEIVEGKSTLFGKASKKTHNYLEGEVTGAWKESAY